MYFPYIFGDLNLMSGAHDDPSVTALGGPNGDPTRPIVQSHWKLLDPGGSALLDEPTFPLVHHELFVDRDVPLWNPDAAFGTPLAAAMQQQPFYPLGAVVMAAPSPITFAAYLMLRLFVAGFATYLFLRFFVGFVPALGGGVAFMLNGYFVKYGTMPHLSVETLTGALFLGVEYVLRARKTLVRRAVPGNRRVVRLPRGHARVVARHDRFRDALRGVPYRQRSRVSGCVARALPRSGACARVRLRVRRVSHLAVPRARRQLVEHSRAGQERRRVPGL